MICSKCGFETMESTGSCPRCGAALSVAGAAEQQELRFASSFRRESANRNPMSDAGQWKRPSDFGAPSPTPSPRSAAEPAFSSAAPSSGATRPAASEASIPTGSEGNTYPGSSYSGSPYPESPYPESSYPGNAYPGSTNPGSTYPGSTYPSNPGIRRSSTSARTVKLLSIVTAGISVLLAILWFCKFVTYSTLGKPIFSVSAYELHCDRAGMSSTGELELQMGTFGIVVAILIVALCLASAVVSLLPIFLKRPNRSWMFVLQVVYASVFLLYLLGVVTMTAVNKIPRVCNSASLTFGAVLMYIFCIAQIVLLCVTRAKSKKCSKL